MPPLFGGVLKNNMFIIAGIGLNSYKEENLRKIILSGADMIRYNFAYRGLDENLKNLIQARTTIDNLNSSTKIIVSLPINKVRLGEFDIKLFSVQEEQTMEFKSANYSPNCNDFIPVDVEKLGEKVEKGQTITIGDGEVAIRILEIIDADTIKVQALNNGVIRFRKTFNIHTSIHDSKMLNDYEKIINKTIELNPDYYSISYSTKNNLSKIKEIIQKHNHHPKIIIRLEGQEAIDNLEEICNDTFYNLILMDRGEMGVNLPYEKIGIYQDKIIKTAKKYKKNIVISTQILESTINNYIPCKSDVTDLTNIVKSKADGIMLCKETVVGKRPSYTISVAKKIIETVTKEIK